MRAAQNHQLWHNVMEFYVQQWTNNDLERGLQPNAQLTEKCLINKILHLDATWLDKVPRSKRRLQKSYEFTIFLENF